MLAASSNIGLIFFGRVFRTSGRQSDNALFRKSDALQPCPILAATTILSTAIANGTAKNLLAVTFGGLRFGLILGGL
jgi:hypothetical protein